MNNFWNDTLYPLLSSQATTTLIALIAAIGAFLIYFIRRRDSKNDAANIILLELKNAERNLEDARKVYEGARSKNPNAVEFPEKLRLMSTESWTKYKYLFVRDFSPEQWEEVSNFYENCRNFDDALELKDASFKLNSAEIRANIQHNVGIYSKELADALKPNPDNDQKIDKINQNIIQEFIVKKNAAVDANIRKLVEIYDPDKLFNDTAYYYSLLPRSIINTPTGDKLKKLATRRWFFRSSRK